jgi:putative membrane protein
MKGLLRIFLFCLFALWLTPNFISAFKIIGDFKTLVISAIVLSLIYLFIRPILNIFFLPINLLSLGLLSWLTNVAVLYLLTFFVPQIKITNWQFSGISYEGFIVPAYHFNQLLTYIIVSLFLTIVINFLTWLCRD